MKYTLSDEINKVEGKWVTSEGEEWTNTHVRDFIISAVLDKWGIRKVNSLIILTNHEDVS